MFLFQKTGFLQFWSGVIALMLRHYMRKTVLTGIWRVYSFAGIVIRMYLSLPENKIPLVWGQRYKYSYICLYKRTHIHG